VLAAEGATGDGIKCAQDIGGAFDPVQRSDGQFMPVSVLKNGNQNLVFPHVIMDRARPGLIAVDHSGRRFVNEASSYHDFVLAMIERSGTAGSAFLICDSRFIREYGSGLVKPRWSFLKPFVEKKYLRAGATLEDLAHEIGVDGNELSRTVFSHNAAALTGIDLEMGKGSNLLNRFNGDATVKPNPCLAPIVKAPFFAIEVFPGLIGTTSGIATNIDACALRPDGTPIKGLYVCGSDMSSLMRGTYPGPGINLGPAITFAYRAANHMANGLPASSSHPFPPEKRQ
jgi:succinate dehydrogenase/fumarate reductase flavoprotein subunit